MRKYAALGLLAAIFVTLFLPVSSARASTLGCLYDKPRAVSQNTVESYQTWRKRQNRAPNEPSCYADTKAVRAIYERLAKTALLELQQKDKNEFNKRYETCTKGSGTTLNPGTWITSLKCLFSVSFFPTSDVLKVKFGELLNDFKSHQPTSYVPISLAIVNNVKNNWGGTDCSTGAITMQVKVPSMADKWKFIVPCKPPTPLQAFRNLMVVSVWLGFAFWLYRIANQFWKERQS